MVRANPLLSPAERDFYRESLETDPDLTPHDRRVLTEMLGDDDFRRPLLGGRSSRLWRFGLKGREHSARGIAPGKRPV